MIRSATLLLGLTVALLAAPPVRASEEVGVGDARSTGIVLDEQWYRPQAVSTPQGAVLLLTAGRGGLQARHRDPAGRWRTTMLTSAAADAFPLTVPVEDGRLMALWIEGRTRLLARIFAPDGTPGPVATVLDGAALIFSGDTESRFWEIRHDDRGTVVVAAPTAPADDRSGGVLVAVREPGGAFGPQQLVHAPTAPGCQQNPLAISAIAQNGSVRVGWQDGYGGPWSQVARTARGAFGAPTASTYATLVSPSGAGFDVGVPSLAASSLDPLASGTRSIGVLLDESSTTTVVGSRIRRLCSRSRLRRCSPATRVPHGGDALVLSPRGDDRVWLAAREAGGGFDRPQVVADAGQLVVGPRGRGYELLVATPRDDLREDLVSAPVGPGAAPRQPPRPTPRASAFSRRGEISVQAWCTGPCRLRARIAGTRTGARALILDRGRARPAKATLAIGDVGTGGLRLAPGTRRVRVVFTASGHAGRRTATVTYRRVRAGRLGADWCRVGVSSVPPCD